MPTGADVLAWDLPRDWTETPGEGMRFATIKPSAAQTGAGKIDVSVIMLPGPAGGELANVNRWRGQIGLAPIEDGARTQMRKEVKSKAGTVSLYDFIGEGPKNERMLAGLLFANGKSWFLKMVGDLALVEASHADFLKLLGTLHFPASN
jgi:hypothetical protein